MSEHESAEGVVDLLAALQKSVTAAKAARAEAALALDHETECMCGANGGEGCWCCTDECPDDCTANHRGEQ